MTSSRSVLRRRHWLAVLLLPVVLLALLLGPALIGQRRLAFRDVGHFYTPLYGYLAERSVGWQLPLWNPLDHTGIPIAGESTTALFYPPRLVFQIGLPAEHAMAWYVAIHLLLAAWGTSWAARSAGASPAGSAAAAVAYPFAGPVLFLYCNPPFLVGAAWLPIALAAALRCCQGGDRRMVAATAAALAMPVLAGDPQTTGHVMIVLALLLIHRGIRAARQGAGVAAVSGCVRLLAALSLAAGLAAPQLAASLDWARHSDRWFERPPGIGRLLVADATAATAADATAVAAVDATAVAAVDAQRGQPLPWWRTPAAGSHAAAIYDFSVPPWHWCQLLVPAAGGQLFPQFQRLSSLVPGDSRVWTLTLYAGLLPLLAWCLRLQDGWRRRGRTHSGNRVSLAALGESKQMELLRGRKAGFRRVDKAFAAPRQLDVWDALVPLGLLLSLGTFGAVWLIRQLSLLLGYDLLADAHSAIGGPYWALVGCVPGYGSFRYPAKWLPLVALGLSVAAARCLSRLSRRRRRALLGGALGAAAACLLVAALSGPVAVRQLLLARLPAALPSDRFWGPLQADAALRMVAISALHVAIVALLIGACVSLRGRGHWRRPWRRSRPLVLTAVLALDLLVVGWPQIATVDRSLEAAVVGADALDDVARDAAALDTDASPSDPLEPHRRWMRTRAGGGWPAVWSTTHSEQRIAEVEISQRRSLFGRWHLDRQQGVFNGAVSITPQRYRSFWDATEAHTGAMASDQRDRFWIAVSRWLGLEAHLLTTDRSMAASVGEATALALVDTHRIPVAAPLPPARWHARWETIPPQPSVSVAQWRSRLESLLADPQGGVPLLEWSGDRPQGLSRSAGSVAPAAIGDFHNLQIIQQTDQLVRLRVTAAAAGLVSLQQYQDGNWQCRYRRASNAPWVRAVVAPVDYLALGSLLPAGTYEVEFRYQPAWLWPSLALMLASALGLLWMVRRAMETGD